MGKEKHRVPRLMRAVSGALLALGCAGLVAPAMAADVGRDIIGPHEYDLPTHFEPTNIFVQYGDWGNSGSNWNSAGDRVSGPHQQQIIGVSKYVRIWAPSWAPDIGLGYEALLPEVNIRTPSSTPSSASGFGDPLTGPVIWFKPIAIEHLNITLGQDALFSVPVGNKDVGGGDHWAVNTAFLYNINYYKWNLVGDVGVVAPLGSSAATRTRPGMQLYFDDTLAYQVLPHVAPFFATTYSTTGSTRDSSGTYISRRGHEILAGGGVYFTMFGNQSLTLRYSRGVDGKNVKATNEIGVKYAVVW